MVTKEEEKIIRACCVEYECQGYNYKRYPECDIALRLSWDKKNCPAWKVLQVLKSAKKP